MSQAQLYTRRFSRRFPGLFIILLDQSRSMGDPVKGTKSSKADFATTALNNLIYALVEAAPYDAETGKRYNYAYLTILGYSEKVTSLLSPDGVPISIPYIAEHPRGTAPIVREMYNAHANKMERKQENRPFWIEPHWYLNTYMTHALEAALATARAWITSPPDDPRRQAAHAECFPPIIINITDGENNGPGDPIQLSKQIRSEGTQQGANLLFNCHFTAETSRPVVFPRSVGEVERLDRFAPHMFEMSSEIPEPLRDKARDVAGHDVLPGARGMIFNGTTNILIDFLNWGTVGPGNDIR